jgi:phage recombination protein Bet
MLARNDRLVRPVSSGISFSEEDISIIKNVIAKDCTDDELKLFLAVCKSTGLNPFAKQIYCVKRKSKDPKYQDSMRIQTGIDGFRLIAQRTGKYRGQLGAYWCGNDGKWVDVWLSDDPPAAAKVGVIHADFGEPLWKVAKFKSYNQSNYPSSLWVKMPEVMIAKVAEALAIRAAFPQELSGLYTADEMNQADFDQQQPQPQIQDYVNVDAIKEVKIIPESNRKSLFAEITAIKKKYDLSKEDLVSHLKELFPTKESSNDLSDEELEAFIEFLVLKLEK